MSRYVEKKGPFGIKSVQHLEVFETEGKGNRF